MLTPPVRANGRYNGCIGGACIFAAGVLLFFAWYNLDLLTTWFEALGYVGEVLFVALGLLVGAVILVRHWLTTERDCDKIDANTRAYDPDAVHGGPGYSGPTTGAIHYDGVQPDSVNVSVDGKHYTMDTRTGELR